MVREPLILLSLLDRALCNTDLYVLFTSLNACTFASNERECIEAIDSRDAEATGTAVTLADNWPSRRERTSRPFWSISRVHSAHSKCRIEYRYYSALGTSMVVRRARYLLSSDLHTHTARSRIDVLPFLAAQVSAGVSHV